MPAGTPAAPVLDVFVKVPFVPLFSLIARERPPERPVLAAMAAVLDAELAAG